MSDPRLLTGVALLFVASFLAVQSLHTARAGRRAVKLSLSAIGAGSDTLRGQDAGRLQLAALLERFSGLGHRLTSAESSSKLAAQLDLAGNPPLWTLERLLALKALLALAGSALSLLLFAGSGARAVLLAALCGAAAFFLPNLLVYNAGEKRQKQIQDSLPDALDLLTISVEAGMGFDGAMRNVARNTHGPLAGEFFRVLQELQMKSRAESFRALGERTTVADLRTFVSSIVQADALGIPIARVLREQSKEMRVKRRQRAEEKAMKVPVKVLFPMAVCILPVLFIVVLAPAFMGMARSW